MNIKIRTIYFKVTDMAKAVAFWKELLGIEPHKQFDSWHEFMTDNIRLGLLLNDFGDQYTGSNCVPVFELPDEKVMEYVNRAKKLGATVIKEGLDDPDLKSVVFADPFGNEFEISKFHD
jgi:catechol 2,3-dioxygenase-like lactoylglutathione lyase family enzyme